MANGSNRFSNAMFSQRSGEFRRNAAVANADAEGGEIDLPAELTGTGAQDLFIYSLPKLTIGKGERAAVSIFTADGPTATSTPGTCSHAARHRSRPQRRGRHARR